MSRTVKRLLPSAVAMAAGALVALSGTAAGQPGQLGDPSATHGSTTSQRTSTTPGAAAPNQELKEFQAEHGLRQTGRPNNQTHRELQRAPESEVRELYSAPVNWTQEQINNARTIIGVGKGENIPKRGHIIALMAAMQESSLRNLSGGDRDSLGLFQQRPSQGWGTPEQILNPVLSTRSFYGVADYGHNPGLLQISNWQNRPRGDVAQAIQRSAYPDAYDKWTQPALNLWNEQAPSTDPIPHDDDGDNPPPPSGQGCTSDGPRVTDYEGDAYPTRNCGNYLGGYTQAKNGTRSGYLNKGTNWFVCQKQFSNWENPAVGNAHNNFWLYTQGDRTADTTQYDAWGWFPATKVSGGGDYEPIPGLARCSDIF